MAHRFFLAYFIFASCQVAGESITYKLKGQEVNWTTTITNPPDDILWKHNGNKVVEFNGKEQREFGQYDNRLILNWHSAELTIKDLTYEDSGAYELEVSKGNTGFQRFPYELKVIDKVAKPTIACQMDNGSDSKTSGMLVCSAEPSHPESLMTFEWSSRGTVQPGHQLTIFLGKEHDDEEYSCTVSNPLTRETTTFTAKDCYSDKSSSVALTASLVIILIIFIIIFILGLVFCKQKQKACFAKRNDLEKQPPPKRPEESDKEDQETVSLLARNHTCPSSQPQAALMDPQQDEKPAKGLVAERKKMFELSPGQPERPITNKRTTKGAGKKEVCSAPLPDQSETLNAARGNSVDLEEQSPPEITEGLEKNKDEHGNITPPPSSPRSESPSLQDQNNLASSDKGDADADQPEESAGEEEEDPAGVSELEPSAAPEQPEFEKESDEDEELPSANGVPPAAQPRTPLTHNSTNMAPEDTAEDHTEDSDQDQVSGETSRNLRDNSIEAEPLSTIPEQKGSDTTLHEQDKDKDKMDKSASAAENESDSEDDNEQEDKEPNLYLANSEQPPSPSPTKPDNNTAQEPADIAHAHSGQGKTRHESGEGEGETADDKN